MHKDNNKCVSEREKIFVLPSVVSNFTQYKITEECQSFYLSLISEWYCRQLHQLYIKNQNIAYSAHSSSFAVVYEFERIEDNFTQLLIMFQDKYKDDTTYIRGQNQNFD